MDRTSDDPLATRSVAERLGLLGLGGTEAPTDRVTSAVAALACFPMSMVANVHAWTSETQFRVPLLDLPGIEAIAESIEMGRQEAGMPAEVDAEHSRVLVLLNRGARATDRVVYEFALGTLALYLAAATPAVAESLRAAIARSIVGVAGAAGKGFFSGRKFSPEELDCIQRINLRLRLDESAGAVEALRRLDP